MLCRYICRCIYIFGSPFPQVYNTEVWTNLGLCCFYASQYIYIYICIYIYIYTYYVYIYICMRYRIPPPSGVQHGGLDQPGSVLLLRLAVRHDALLPRQGAHASLGRRNGRRLVQSIHIYIYICTYTYTYVHTYTYIYIYIYI